MPVGPSEQPAIGEWLTALRGLHRRILAEVRACQTPPRAAGMAAVRGTQGGDVIYAIDAHVETLLVEWCEEMSRQRPFVLVAEGINENGEAIFPAGASRVDAQFILLVDPIDGTRGLMYDKRSAWILSGVAPNRGPETSLRDIQCAVMTELPTSRARLADQLWAVRGCGAEGETWDLAGDGWPRVGGASVTPSRAENLHHGFASVVKFFPGGKELTARIEEELLAAIVETPSDGLPLVFDDQYISTGGQLRELIAGHDRFTADLRPVLLPAVQGAHSRLCAHPYDLASLLIAEEAGVVVCDPWGTPLNAPLRVHHDVGWVGYANSRLREYIQPRLSETLRRHGFHPPGERDPVASPTPGWTA